MSFETHFTQIPNAYLRTRDLSYKAAGVLAHLMSHAPGTEVSLKTLAGDSSDPKDQREGIAAVRTAVEELERHGYLVRQNERGDKGTYGTKWHLTEPGTPLPGMDDFTAFDNRTRSSTAFDNRTNTAFDNRTHKEHYLRTPSKTSQGKSRPRTEESERQSRTTSGDGFALAASVERMNAPDAAVCPNAKGRRPHTPEPSNPRYCRDCGARTPDDVLLPPQIVNTTTGEVL
ncbi:hypothetical protein [Plantibacter sp. YIM 135249]|uniref:hypothetical protein n=1 Tax=Plantibacter sp. YIM 135249 TaxID=3423918 RepID=UPI003D330F14